MNPENNALKRTHFIGGPPRVCKGILANRFARQIHGHVTSTDAIVDAVKEAFKKKEGDLFVVNQFEELPDVEWIRRLEEPKKIVEIQNTESRAAWPSVLGFCNNFYQDNEIHILEGVAILPELVVNMQHRPDHIVFVGNTGPAHWKMMLEHSHDNPELDWMATVGFDEDKIKAMGVFVQKMSEYFRNEATKYGFRYAEISDENFDEDIQQIVNEITSGR